MGSNLTFSVFAAVYVVANISFVSHFLDNEALERVIVCICIEPVCLSIAVPISIGMLCIELTSSNGLCFVVGHRNHIGYPHLSGGRVILPCMRMRAVPSII